jgi:hydrogenase nickel incorporation protein HypA/HybF
MRRSPFNAVSLIMHELVLSDNIVRAVLAEVSVPKSRIMAIGIDVGALSTVNASSLEFCLRAVLDEGGMPHTEVRLNLVPAKVKCSCGLQYTTDDVFSACPGCGSFVREVVEGTEVSVRYVELEDEQA